LHHQLSDFALKVGEHAGVLLRSGLSRFCKNLFGGSDSLLSFLILHAASGGVSFFDQFGGLPIGLQDYVPTCGLGLSQFRFYLFGVSQSLGNLLPTFLQYF